MAIDISSLPKEIQIPLVLFIIGIIIYAGYEILDAIAETSDSPEVSTVVNNSKEALGNLQEGAKTAADVQDALDSIPIS